MILDLRDNPGGFLGGAIHICDEFLESGELIVFTEGKYRKKHEYFSSSKGSLKDIQLVILIQ